MHHAPLPDVLQDVPRLHLGGLAFHPLDKQRGRQALADEKVETYPPLGRLPEVLQRPIHATPAETATHDVHEGSLKPRVMHSGAYGKVSWESERSLQMRVIMERRRAKLRFCGGVSAATTWESLFYRDLSRPSGGDSAVANSLSWYTVHR